MPINNPGGSGGASAFTELADVPASYSGQGGKVVAVNSGATALEFVNPGASSDPWTYTNWSGDLTTGIDGGAIITLTMPIR